MKKDLIFAAGAIMLSFALFLGFKISDHVSPSEAQPPVAQVATARPAVQQSPVADGTPVIVERVVDGDTALLSDGEYLRYVGIDTPEEVDARKPVQCFAREAAARDKQLVEGKTITFHKDVSAKDKYGRRLGYLYLADGTFVNLELVKEGYAFAYPFPPDTSRSSEFAAAESAARSAKIGLWGACTVRTLSDGREQTNAIQ